MPDYICKQGDVSYRVVDLNSYALRSFNSMPAVGQKISCNGSSVIEVMREDNTTEIIGDNRLQKHWQRTDNFIRVESDVPTGHLWVRIDGVYYAVPTELPTWPKDSRWKYFQLQKDAAQAELFGDEYFNAVIDLLG